MYTYNRGLATYSKNEQIVECRYERTIMVLNNFQKNVDPIMHFVREVLHNAQSLRTVKE